MKIKNIILIILINFLIIQLGYTQNNREILIDEIVAIIGDKIIKYSDIESQYVNYTMQGLIQNQEETHCQILEELLIEKFLLYQANVDSVTVLESQVESELDARLRYFINQIGSKEKLEAFYNKSITEIKNEYREAIKEKLIAQTMEAKITKDIKISPKEVKAFYNKIPEDSLPLINSEVEIYQIVKKPIISKEQLEIAKFKLNELRERVLKGENFGTLAYMYSDDEVSAKKNGDLGFKCRGDLYPELETAAFALKENEISPVIQTKEGFHIIQLIERRGECVNIRHILAKVKPTPKDLEDAKKYLENIYALITMDSINFFEAAKRYSDDPNKNNSGLIVNPYTGNAKFEVNDLDPQLFFIVDKMEPGQISKPVLMKTDDGQEAYRLLYLKTRTQPHKANLKDDYDRIQAAALEDKKRKVIGDWINNKLKNTYIRISEDYKDCDFQYNWFNN